MSDPTLPSHSHAHGEHHDHKDTAHPGHSHGHDSYAQANEVYFDENAHTQEKMTGVAEALDRINSTMRCLYNFKEDETRMLDFACGTGNSVHILSRYKANISAPK